MRRSGIVALVIAFAGAPAHAAESPASGPLRPSAGGRLMWIASDELELLGDLWADVPLGTVSGGSPFLALDTRTTVERTSSFRFLVHDLVYSLDAGWRRPGPRWHASAFAGQRGKERVDAAGQPWVRFVGAALETPAFLQPTAGPGGRWDWRVAMGAVLQDREVDADAVLRGAARMRLAPRSRSFARHLGLDARLDGLLDGGDLDADVEFGAHVVLAVDAGTPATFFVRYLHGGNPLGPEASGVLAGFEYGGRTRGSASTSGPGWVEGVASAGAGAESRLASQLRLGLVSPLLLGAWRAAFRIDANVLTARDTGELYYLWWLGAERAVEDHVVAVRLYHRSNHELAETNDRVTSLNVAEAGIESVGWDRPGRRDPHHSRGAFEGSASVGVLLNSTFGEDRRWHVRGEGRWSPRPLAPWFGPFVRVQLEAGEIELQTWALGASFSANGDIELQYRRDRQYESEDFTALLAMARYAF